MQAIVDADIVIFRCAVVSEQDSFNVACLRADDMMRRILVQTQAPTYRAFISGGENFRYNIDSNYKAHRKLKADPRWREDLKQFLITEWGAEVTDGIEADDALGIYQTPDTIICSIDKDLKQIPGKHYNFVKEEFFDIEPLEALQFFYKQLMIGDTADNIFGVKGIGPKKADKLIDPLIEEEEMYFTVRRLYDDYERMLRNGKLLWIMKREGDIWTPGEELSTYYDQQVRELALKSETSAAQTPPSSENTGQGTSG